VFRHYQHALTMIEQLLSNTNILDNIKSSAYGWKGYCLKRKGRTIEAFNAAKAAYDLNNKDYLMSYNCSCYAALLNKKQVSLDYLSKTLKLFSDFKDNILSNTTLLDRDLKSLINENEFKDLLGIDHWVPINIIKEVGPVDLQSLAMRVSKIEEEVNKL